MEKVMELAWVLVLVALVQVLTSTEQPLLKFLTTNILALTSLVSHFGYF